MTEQLQATLPVQTDRNGPAKLEALLADGKLKDTRTKFRIRNLNVYYGDRRALRDVSLDIPANEIMALIGPSGCGKSTFLRCLNRMNDIIESCRVDGDICMEGEDLQRKNLEVEYLRARVGMVFQKPNPFPKSIYDNVAYGPRIHGLTRNRRELDEWVLHCLDKAGLVDEVRDRLDLRGTELSGGQQQRLCIARTIAVRPEVILMDEPCSALDPIATARVEELMLELVDDFTIVIVTHNMQQARRVSNRTAYFHMGELVETGETEQLFMYPEDDRTLSYVSGKIG